MKIRPIVILLLLLSVLVLVSAPSIVPVSGAYTCSNPQIQSGGTLTTLEDINAGKYTSAIDKCGTCPSPPGTCQLLEVRNVKVIRTTFISKDGDERIYVTDGTKINGALYSFRIEIPTAYQNLFMSTYGCKFPPKGSTITLDGFPFLDSGKLLGNPPSHWELHPPTYWLRTDSTGGHC
jgi:hypothetical protein